MRDDILIQAIDNTEDVLLHGGKWSEEAKQRVREARRAGRRVSEMFSNLYNSTGRYAIKQVKMLNALLIELTVNTILLRTMVVHELVLNLLHNMLKKPLSQIKVTLQPLNAQLGLKSASINL